MAGTGATGSARPGDSATARAFGASVELAMPAGRGLFLVVGETEAPEAAITGLGGEVLVRVPGSTTVLAVLPVAAHAALRRAPGVTLAGPVVVDPARFARFAGLAGLNGGQASGGGG